MNINEFAKEVHQNAVEHGWWDEPRTFGDIIALCHSELSEALEEFRAGRPMVYRICRASDGCPCGREACGDWNPESGTCELRVMDEKPEGIAVELADCIIRILDYLGKEGIENVAFYNPDGAWGYRPDDLTFEGKQVTVAKLRNWSMETLSTLDVSEALKRASQVRFEQVQMIQDDEKRWALYIKPEGKAGYSVYPDKDDLNRFFTTLKQAMQNISAVRGELASKYYLLAESRPELKADLFSTHEKGIDLNQIERVSVYKTRTDGIQCAVTINGEKLPPRSVTPQQWQRMWVADDPVKYKKHLAATLFADVLRKGLAQEQTTGEKTSADAEQKQTEKAAIDNSAGNTTPKNEADYTRQEDPSLLEQWEELKGKHPDTVLLFRKDDSYEAYKEDAGKAGKILNLEIRQRGCTDGRDMETVAFPSKDLDMFLPKLIRAGCRVAICDQIEPKQERHQERQEEHTRGMKR